ncbi:rCG27755 [Rattus norvegicus]|uniref:RCG27755 n=1 Tax=Rattus norvegicus TaxID=10116 RepID=A6KBL5_RAT|nr:rCG27755 [Rattus norvegicus]
MGPQPDTTAPAACVPRAALPGETSYLTFSTRNRAGVPGGWAQSDHFPLAMELGLRSRPRGK